MHIVNVEQIQSRDTEKFAWNGLAHYANREICYRQIQKLHHPPPNQKENVIKQAEQIRQAILLAKEYYKTSQSASLATKPVLLYYSCMSLALAEILLKQTGDSSLDKARAEHHHHGLLFSTTLDFELDFLEASKKLHAKPMKVGNKYKGTFELWRRSARHTPMVGLENKLIQGGNSTTSIKALLFNSDNELTNIDDKGVTLIDCLMRLPFMERALRVNGFEPFFVRSEFSKIIQPNNQQYFNLLIHPAPEHSLANLLERFKINAELVNFFEIYEFESGYNINWPHNENTSNLTINFPSGINTNTKIICLGTGSLRLNEFGNIYISLYILSNLSRYYPDIWIKHIENHTSLSLVVSEFCEKAAERMALMAYSELSRILYIE